MSTVVTEGPQIDIVLPTGSTSQRSDRLTLGQTEMRSGFVVEWQLPESPDGNAVSSGETTSQQIS